MTALAPALQAWFTERLITQRNSSPETIAAYRDAFRLLLRFANEQTGKQPFELDLDDLDAPLIGAFLKHLEKDRGNSPRTRNARLGAIHSFYRYCALEHPEHAHTIARVMAIPTKRYERNTLSYLNRDEIAALLAAPDKRTWLSRHDHALLTLMIQTGVRVSELCGLRGSDVHLGTAAHIRVLGKGRKRRATTLTAETVNVLRAWIKERQGQPEEPLFSTRQGRPLSRYTVEVIVAKHAATATSNCPSLKDKHVTPHALRHTNAMLLRAKGVDIATIALWLGHESTQTTHIYEQCATRRPVVSPAQPGGTQGGFLGPMANPDPKGDRNHSMPGKRRSGPGVRGDASRDPRDMAKAELPEAESPEDAKIRPPERHPEPASRSATASCAGCRSLGAWSVAQ
jgi:site-specific recombinase XerD